MSKEKKKTCDCTEECTCGCQEGKECNCNEECKCDEECKCNENNENNENNKNNENNENTKVEELENKIKELEEKALRDKAEMINYRKRKDEEVVRLLKFCNEDLIKQMLPIMDNFERAIKLDDDNLDDEVSKFLEGFKMIYCSMQNVMGNFEVKQIDGANKPFDPVYHNAIMVEQKEGVEPGMVIEVLQKGYIYKDKVIRPAMVKVSE